MNIKDLDKEIKQILINYFVLEETSPEAYQLSKREEVNITTDIKDLLSQSNQEIVKEIEKIVDFIDDTCANNVSWEKQDFANKINEIYDKLTQLRQSNNLLIKNKNE